MRKTLLLGTILLATTSAWALGGMFDGITGHKSHHSGVSAIGVHYSDDDKKPDIKIRTCDSKTEELIGSECCLKSLIYNDNGVSKCCSAEGYALQDGKCQKADTNIDDTDDTDDTDIQTCDSETEELVGSECLPKCPEGLERNTDGSCTICKNGKLYLSYMDDPCNTDVPGTGCRTNKECDEQEFCQLNYTYMGTAVLNGECTALGESQNRTFNGQNFVVNLDNYMNYLTAENWCRAQGMTMASLDDLGLDENVYCDDSCWENVQTTFNTSVWLWTKDTATISGWSTSYAYCLYRNTEETPFLPMSVTNSGPTGGAICK